MQKQQLVTKPEVSTPRAKTRKDQDRVIEKRVPYPNVSDTINQEVS